MAESGKWKSNKQCPYFVDTALITELLRDSLRTPGGTTETGLCFYAVVEECCFRLKHCKSWSQGASPKGRPKNHPCSLGNKVVRAFEVSSSNAVLQRMTASACKSFSTQNQSSILPCDPIQADAQLQPQGQEPLAVAENFVSSAFSEESDIHSVTILYWESVHSTALSISWVIFFFLKLRFLSWSARHHLFLCIVLLLCLQRPSM